MSRLSSLQDLSPQDLSPQISALKPTIPQLSHPDLREPVPEIEPYPSSGGRDARALVTRNHDSRYSRGATVLA